jgi:hypothetical protein
VVQQNLFFGRYDFGQVPALEVLRDGSGIIDIVNTYLIIALKGGIVSLGLFVGLIAAAILGLVAGLLKIKDRRDERHALGRALLATMLGVLFIIATVSPIFFVYPIYWSLAGLLVGYGRLMARGEAPIASMATPAKRGQRTAAPRWKTAAAPRDGT